MSERAWTPDEQLVWCLARRVRADDVLVVGVATPLAAAAAHLARAVLEPDVTIIEAAAVDVAEHDVADPFLRPDDVARSAVGVLTQIEILDAIQRGRVSLQFVSPAQVDGRGALNTSRVPGGEGGLRRLPGGLATADVSQLSAQAPGALQFLRFEVEFDLDALDAGVSGDTEPISLDFLKVPFLF